MHYNKVSVAVQNLWNFHTLRTSKLKEDSLSQSFFSPFNCVASRKTRQVFKKILIDNYKFLRSTVDYFVDKQQ